MAFKFFAVLALVSAASAGDFAVAPAYTAAYAQPHYGAPAGAPLASPVFANAVGPAYVKGYAAPVVKQLQYEAPAKYNFAYGVNDPHTGDVKEQSESREGDNVHGSYSLIDADGFKRTVEYTADEHNGFNAVVHREPLGHAPPAKVVAPVQYATAPAVAKVVGPAAYAAPVAHYASAPAQYPAYAHLGAHGAPVAHYAAAPAVAKVATYTAPAGYAAPTGYAAPVAYHAPAAYYAPAAYHAPAAYASPVVKLAAPVAHYAASPLAYSAPNQFYHH